MDSSATVGLIIGGLVVGAGGLYYFMSSPATTGDPVNPRLGETPYTSQTYGGSRRFKHQRNKSKRK